MSCCVSIADLMTVMTEYQAAANGVEASYYPQVLTGYDTDETERDPSEETVVAVEGVFSNLTLRNEDDAITRSATFTLAYDPDLGFTPTPTDRVVIDSVHYRVTEVLVEQWGDTPASYTLTLRQ